MVVVEIDHRDPDLALRVRDLQRVAYRIEAELIGYDRMPPLREEVTDILRLDLTILGAMEGASLIGVLGYVRVSGTVDIDRLAVEPARFRRGVGRMLLDGLHLRESDASRFEVSTGAANRPAIALYEAMGYRLTSEEISHDVRLAHFARQGQR